MLGFSSGIMIAASFWSLLLPALELWETKTNHAWFYASLSFLSGGLVLYLIHKFLPHLHVGLESNRQEGGRSSFQRSILLVIAITLHNIPEGLAVGVAFGALGDNFTAQALASALVVAFGIGIQNIPEGAAVSIPLLREGFSVRRSFWYGQLSGFVEPLGGLLGAALVFSMANVLPFALCFAAGAMIFVVIEELIPESHTGQETEMSTLGALFGFVLMMALDLGLGA
ncbi:ZIP zinc transporter family protein [Leptospira ryugenii]|uniref:ZIP zinc transporter family protein n=2 Tax=Leptospira ryugenii TaxID=1917863 RepID=A0A2P2E0K1_9LEPT|nr:ZIP zinc transporter family protein [Leptospira ryugenii]